MPARAMKTNQTGDDPGDRLDDRGCAEAALRESEKNYRTLFREMLEGFALHEIICDGQGNPADYRFLAVNPAFERMTGLTADELVGRTVLEVLPGTERHWIETYGKVALTGEPVFFENYSAELKKHFEVTAFRPAPNQFACMFADITESEREKLQEQLAQARKMESVGRLAGGVAHDFNNLLMCIINYVELCKDGVPLDHPIRCYLDEIGTAAQRSANLTRQLLAFARRQPISPKALDLNTAVAGMLKLLQRLIGEDIDLIWNPGEGLWPVKLDPAQVDQLLANLCVNARDAISGVGRVAIETANVAVDRAQCAGHAEAIPGEYVLLAVSDNGCGMTRDVLDHVFEPFFTTKGVGRGTGLGLATVHGIVRQNNGFVIASSEPGKGTTFRLYLPRVSLEIDEVPQARPAAAPRGRGETVLLVEDERSLRESCALFLDALGYKVLVADTPAVAQEMAVRYPDEIQLMLTDVVMPGMDGRQLAERLQASRPTLKCLFMSGYTADVIAHRGVLDEGVQFLSKPFSRDDLARKVRAVLERP